MNKQISLELTDYRFSSVKITASCLWIWFIGIHL